MANSSRAERETIRAQVGSRDNFWAWSKENGWDLTRTRSLDTKPCEKRLELQCELSFVTMDPRKTALLVIDMQNFSLCTALTGNPHVHGLGAEHAILEYAVPKARETGIQVVWLNWGLTNEDLETMPPGPLRAFGWEANDESVESNIAEGRLSPPVFGDFSSCGERQILGLGADIGAIVVDDGSTVEAGRALMKGSWNASLYGPFLSAFDDGQSGSLPDVVVHKNRNSGLWDENSGCTKYLVERGIRTLLFTGMNTDQCVLSTLIDAQARGFDPILLRDGCNTSNPGNPHRNVEFNCCHAFGFLSSCKAFSRAVLHDNSR